MNIKRVGSQPSNKGPADWFTGTVRVDPLFTAPEPARVVGASVTFEPGARTAWHTHPVGQVLEVVSGKGWVQVEGEAARAIGVGDVVVITAGENHWHGAQAGGSMVHLAINEQDATGSNVSWGVKVTEEEYTKTGN